MGAGGRCVVPLVQCDGAGKYHACQETLSWIASHKRPFGVVACAGKYRTGKSFMLNRLAECGAEGGFGVGDTVQACTKGLWVCKHFFRVNDTMDALIVDSEGIDALDASDDGDVRIFTLALLLSSSFLYNSVGHIDEAAISTLSLMTRVADVIRESGSDDATTKTTLPSFHWILRDFSLLMEDADGNAIGSGAYLAQSLTVPSTCQESDPRAATRRAIVDMFADKHLHTLPRPASETELRNLMEKPWLISARFHEAIDAMRTTLWKGLAPVSTSTGVPLTGSMYASLVEHLCTHGGRPSRRRATRGR